MLKYFCKPMSYIFHHRGIKYYAKGWNKNSAERTKRNKMQNFFAFYLPEGVCLYAEWFDEFVVHLNGLCIFKHPPLFLI